MKHLIKRPEFKHWIQHSLQRKENILAVSNQGTVLHYQANGLDLIVKTAMGRGLVLKARRKTLLREFEAYRRLDGLRGVPACYGLLDGRYLVLEFIRGTLYRQANWVNRGKWFRDFLKILQSVHERGVIHGDLKSKSNILVTADEKPCIIDFGTTILRKPGFHPLNGWLFEYGRRLDINAWVKHKYFGRYADASATDRDMLNYSRIEYLVRKLNGRSMDAVSGTRKKR